MSSLFQTAEVLCACIVMSYIQAQNKIRKNVNVTSFVISEHDLVKTSLFCTLSGKCEFLMLLISLAQHY
jgi:hypothetical protein